MLPSNVSSPSVINSSSEQILRTFTNISVTVKRKKKKNHFITVLILQAVIL